MSIVSSPHTQSVEMDLISQIVQAELLEKTVILQCLIPIRFEVYIYYFISLILFCQLLCPIDQYHIWKKQSPIPQ